MSKREEDMLRGSTSSDTESYERVETEQSEYEDSVIDEPICSSSTFIAISKELPMLQQPFIDEYLSKKSMEILSTSVATANPLTDDENTEVEDADDEEELIVVEDSGQNKKNLNVWIEKWKDLMKIFEQHRVVIGVGIVLIVFLAMSLQMFALSNQLETCELQNQELSKTVEFLASGGQISPDQLKSEETDESMMNFINKQNLYLGRCKKLRFKTLEKLGIIKKPGNIVICI